MTDFAVTARSCQKAMADIGISSDAADRYSKDGSSPFDEQKPYKTADAAIGRFGTAVESLNLSAKRNGMQEIYQGSALDKAQLLSFLDQFRQEAVPEGEKRHEAMRQTDSLSITVTEKQVHDSSKDPDKAYVAYRDTYSQTGFSSVEINYHRP